jgi:diguanylate cyclase (GGDEF)-like protein
VADKPRFSEVQRLNMIIEVQQEINAATLDLDSLLNVVTERAQMITAADGGVVEIADDGEMVYRSVSGMANSWLGFRLPIDQSLSGLCAQSGTPLLCNDTDIDSRVDAESCRRIGVRSMIVVPLIHLGVAVGVLKVMSAEPSRFDEVDIATLRTLAGFIASSLNNASDHGLQVHQALHDPLTGLPNRALLKDRLEQALKKAGRQRKGVGVFFIDLDGFKQVNDSYGHGTGDALLRAVAFELSASLRASDTLARFGGDEFVLVCEDAGWHVEDAVRARIAQAMARVAASAPEFATIRASVGAAWEGQSQLGADELLSAADASMYRSKRAAAGGEYPLDQVGD